MADVNNSVAELITKEGYINGANAKVAPFAYDSIGYANETQEGIEGVSEYSYGNNQNIPIGDAKNLDTNSTTLSKGLRSQASSIPRQIMNHFFGRTSFNLNKIHEWFLRFLGCFQTHLRQDNNLWSPTAKYELGDVCFVLDTLTVDGADKHIARAFRCIKSVSGGLVNVRPIDADTHEVNTEYWQENNVYDELYALHFHGQATDIADGAVTTAKLSDNAVTTAKIADGAVTNAKIGETISIAKGGTGATTARDGFTSLANGLPLEARPEDEEKIIFKNAAGTGWGLYTLSILWNYIKGKISSVLGLTAANYGGTAARANTAAASNQISPNFTTIVNLTSAATIKYIKLADCVWYQNGTLQVFLGGVAFEDTLVLNFGGGNGATPMLCGRYCGNASRILSVIAQKASNYSGNYSIYIKVNQLADLTVKVALLTGNCTIDISETTTAPTNISEWSVNYGLFGTFTGNLTGSATQIADGAVTNAKIGETISIAKGGTGATTARDGFTSLANGLPLGAGPEDEEKIIFKNAAGTGWGLYTLSILWDYIKSKILAMTGWITAGMCRSGSNLYMHYISLTAVNRYIFFSFPSAQASSYTSFSALLTALRNLFGERRFSCNGAYEISVNVFGTIQYGYVDAQASSLGIVAIKPEGKLLETPITKIGSSLVDTVVPIISN